jgi:putative heme-binding domain-containing protein
MTSEGRIYRIAAKGAIPSKFSMKPMRERTVPELIQAFASPLPVHRIDAQDELVRRGPAVGPELIMSLEGKALSEAQETWTAWALGRMGPDAFFEKALEKAGNLRIQALRILARNFPDRLPAKVRLLTKDADPRIRFEAVQCLWQTRQSSAIPILQEVAAQEQDRLTYYSAWRALRDLAGTSALKTMLHDNRGGVRRAALLALLEDGTLSKDEVRDFETDSDDETKRLAKSWSNLMNGGGPVKLVKDRGIDTSKLAPITGPPPVLVPQTSPVTLEAAMAAMSKASPERGRLLVLHPQGAGCIVCHYVAGHGNHFGPELDGIGDRAEARHLLQSMIDPSAVITEGFNSHVITTAQGTQMGILLEESGLSITLGLVTGQRVRIMRADIIKHETLPVSAMPPFNMTLSTQQCADIAAWLQTRKAGVPLEIQKKNKKPKTKR